LEKSISNRFYFDYNATSPLAKKVIDFLHGGDFYFGNPASQHQTGKNAKKIINETSDYLFKSFSLSSQNHKIFYHSGASEGINSIFKGIALKFFNEHKKASFFFSEVDHACVIELKDFLETLGHKVIFFQVDKNGVFHKENVINLILKEKTQGSEPFLNYTYVNNESGVVWPLSWAVEIKNQSSAFIHVDAVQIVGKIPNWNELDQALDAYTFSGHKFGSLKGIGFSFLQNKSQFPALITGGTQQEGLRAGTENALGIYSLKLALLDMTLNFNSHELAHAKDIIEKGMIEFIGPKGEVVGVLNPNRNLNTIFLILYGQKAESLSIKFDMNSIDVSTGSACSSGIIKESRVLMKMGYKSEEARSALRFSFSPYMTKEEASSYLDKIKSVLKSVIS